MVSISPKPPKQGLTSNRCDPWELNIKGLEAAAYDSCDDTNETHSQQRPLHVNLSESALQRPQAPRLRFCQESRAVSSKGLAPRSSRAIPTSVAQRLIAEDHERFRPTYGWRRIPAELAGAYGQQTNKKFDLLDHGSPRHQRAFGPA